MRLAPLQVLPVLIALVMASLPTLAFAEEGPSKDAAVANQAAAPAEEAEADAPPSNDALAYSIDNIMLLIAAVLVLFMQAGFAMLEVGLNAAKNATNILFKNIMDLSVGVLLFFVIGYGLMYPGDDAAGKAFGFGQVGIAAAEGTGEAGKLHPQVDFLFQVAFAATAATIVSGAVAGRMKFGAYLIYSAVLTGLIYPISGMWKWGGGWLNAMGFADFAGSVVVHAVGGFAGLAGAIILGPRIGRFLSGKSTPMPGHNLTFAALGVIILWIGWYGFNPGSQLAFAGDSNIAATVTIAVNTTLSAAAGAVIAMLIAWMLFTKPDLTMALNGALAGLVGITANCDAVSNIEALLIGSISGVIVIAGIMALDKLKIDDPVGAFPVHGLCGVWGCVAMGLFGNLPEVEGVVLTRAAFIGVQLLGTVVICLWAFGTMLGVFALLKALGILRVSREEEIAGLDITEHGMHAYPPNVVNEGFAGTPVPAPASN